MEWLNNGINSPKGFKSAGIHCGVKRKRKDLSIIVSKSPCQYAGVYTKNLVKAAPVIWNMERLNKNDLIFGVVINSGNANACTGEKGYKDCVNMAIQFSDGLNELKYNTIIKKENVLVASTGVIGIPLKMNVISEGINTIVKTASSSKKSGLDAAEGIMTTDKFTKVKALKIKIKDKEVIIAGMSKGSGMIHPNMGTMLSFITTDANISSELLTEILKESVNDTYNMISVDGDTSTNDMVIVLANGESGSCEIIKNSEEYYVFKEAINKLNEELGKLIVKDGEGATKFIEVQVNEMNNVEEAKKMVHAVITSNLVKTAFFGEDANWGRILCALGYSGADFDPSKVDIKYVSASGEILLLDQGQPVKFDEDYALEILKQEEIKVIVNCNHGNSSAKGWGCDFSYDYVKINGDYRT